MKILFTKSDFILSKLIRAVTKEPVSHAAIQCGDWVLHSNLFGVNAELASVFRASATVVYEIEQPMDENKLMAAFAQADTKFYDFGALIYLGLTYLIPWLPKKNLWRSSGSYLCTDWIELAEGEEPDSTMTAYQLYLKLSATLGKPTS